MTNEPTKRCCVCYATSHWLGLHSHHIVGRVRRSDARWATITICGECHGHYHGQTKPGFPKLLLPHILWCKLMEDPDHWNYEKLEYAYCKSLPYPEPLPKEFREERMRNRPYISMDC